MIVPEPTATATRYDVSCLPQDHPERHHFVIAVEWAGPGDLWAVRSDGGWCLGALSRGAFVWDFEPQNSSRTPEWLVTHRFPFEQALKLAKEQAPLMTCNRWTVEAVLAQEWDR